MARKVNVNPLVILLSVLVGVELFGILGALLAVPASGALQVIIKSARQEHQREQLVLPDNLDNACGRRRLMTHIRTARLELDHTVEAPRLARRFVTRRARQVGCTGAVDRAGPTARQRARVECRAARRRARSGSWSTRSTEGERCRVEVCNSGDGQPRMRRASPEELSGRGLQLVDELARGWGSSSDDGQTSVWFEVPTDAAV